MHRKRCPDVASQNATITLTRQQLYDRAWTTPPSMRSEASPSATGEGVRVTILDEKLELHSAALAAQSVAECRRMIGTLKRSRQEGDATRRTRGACANAQVPGVFVRVRTSNAEHPGEHSAWPLYASTPGRRAGRLAETPWPAPFSEVELSALPGCGDGVDAPIRLIRAPEV